MDRLIQLVEQNDSEPVQPDSPELVEVVVDVVIGQVEVNSAIVLQDLPEIFISILLKCEVQYFPQRTLTS